MVDDRRVGDFGQVLEVDVGGVDPTTAETRTIRIRKPSGALLEVIPSSTTSTSVIYTWKVGDLDESGVYHGEVKLVSADTLQFTTTPFEVSVGNPV